MFFTGVMLTFSAAGLGESLWTARGFLTLLGWGAVVFIVYSLLVWTVERRLLGAAELPRVIKWKLGPVGIFAVWTILPAALGGAGSALAGYTVTWPVVAIGAAGGAAGAYLSLRGW